MNTIIEKIKTWVNQRKKELHSTLFNDEYNDFLSFLSDLEKEEKPMNPQPVKIDIRKELASIEFMGVNDARDTETIARHFYELGRQSKEQPLGEDFDLESDRFFRKLPLRANTPPIPDEYIDEETFDKIARHFAQWQKEQMMKEAVEKNGVVCSDEFVKFDDGTFLDFRDPTLGINPAFVLPKNGEKVKVIIVKEDKK